MRATVIGSEPLTVPGGVESVVVSQIRGLEEAGVDVTYVACGDCGRVPIVDRVRGRPLAPFACLRCRARPKPEITLSNGPVGFGFHGTAISAHMYHGTYSGQAAAIRPFIRRRGFVKLTYYDGGVLERLAGKGKTCLANSRSTAAEVARYFGYESTVIWCPVDTDRFSSSGTGREWLERNGARTDLPLVLFMGTDRPMKNPSLAIQAARKVPDAHFVFVGGRRPEGPCTWARAVDRNEMPGLLSSVDLVVTPSLYEPFGILGAESLVSGTPIITSPTGLTEFLESTGVPWPVIPPTATPGELASRIRSCLSEIGHERSRMERAREAIYSRLSPLTWGANLRRVLGMEA